MKNKILYIFSAIIFILFAYISFVTPLAGDDWGYAINGLKQNPLLTAFQFYQNWSGRFFSELLGLILTNHKLIWNILNPLLFTSIYILIIKITNIKKNTILIYSILLFLILSVKDQLRMETYTWIMGSVNYTIVLFLIILLSYLYKLLILYKRNKYYYIILIANFIGSMMVENAAIIIVAINISCLIYTIIKKESNKKIYLLNFIAILGFMILRLSPGAALRLLEHQSFNEMSLITKISQNYPLFIKYTILDNKYLIMILSLTTITYTYQNVKNLKLKVLIILTFIISFIQSISAFIYSIIKLDILKIFFDIDHSILLVSIILILMIISYLYLFTTLDYHNKLLAYIIFILAGLGTGSMLISPIFGSRNSLFTVYLLFILIIILLNNIIINNKIAIIPISIILLLNIIFIRNYYYKYSLVKKIDEERMGQIKYYLDNPDSKEAWIVKMPIMSIHSADVEEWDVYHMDTFKQYYGLNKDMKVIFYYKEQY